MGRGRVYIISPVSHKTHSSSYSFISQSVSKKKSRVKQEEVVMAADPESIAEALVALEITDLAPLKACNSLVDEFHLIKRTYFRKILVAHPDKGGDPAGNSFYLLHMETHSVVSANLPRRHSLFHAEFRLVNTAFELLRSVFEEGGVASFANAAEAKKKRQGGGGGGGGAYRSRQTRKSRLLPARPF